MIACRRRLTQKAEREVLAAIARKMIENEGTMAASIIGFVPCGIPWSLSASIRLIGSLGIWKVTRTFF
ncbi:hypothetical protein BDW68DRAFT_159917 [Aspergillus falconensis]